MESALRSIASLDRYKRIGIAPAGPTTERFLVFLKESFPETYERVVAVSDRSEEKQGQDLYGKPVVSADEMIEQGVEALIIASHAFFYEIVKDYQASASIPELFKASYISEFFQRESELMSEHDTRFFPSPDFVEHFRSEDIPFTPETLLSPSELQLYFHLMKTVFRGEGSVVELGCARGGSTRALLEGMIANEKVSEGLQLSVFDLFQKSKNDWSGSSFSLAVFEELHKDYLPYLQIFSGDITKTPPWDTPIEILVVDIMKSESIATSVVRNFFPHLKEHSILIHQDFKDAKCPWIPIIMFRLREVITPLLNVGDGGTVVFRVEQPLDAESIEGAIAEPLFQKGEINEAFEWSDEICGGSYRPFQVEMKRSYEAASKRIRPSSSID